METNNETLAQTLALTAVATILKFKPSNKFDDNLKASIAADLMPLLPSNKVYKETIAAFASELATKYILLDTQNPTLCHVPDSQLYAGKKTERDLIKAHDFTVNLTTDTEYRLATYVLQLYSKQTNEGTNKELHYPAYALEALQLINGLTSVVDLKGEKQVTTKSDNFDYEALGLDANWFHSGKGAVYTLPNNGGVRHIVKPEFLGVVMPLIFQRLDIFSMKTESSTVAAYDGVMVYTKPAKPAVVDVNFSL